MPIVTIPAAGQYGLIADQPPQECPDNSWTEVENVRFSGGCAERFSGHREVFDAPLVTPYHLAFYQVGDTRFVVHLGLAAAYADDGAARTNITGSAFTGTAADRWTSAVLGGVLIVNNGVDVPQFWAGDTGLNFATLTGWNAAWRAKSIGAFKAFGVAVNVTKSGTNYPHMVKWSHEADPGSVPTSWDETDATKSAGEVDLAETTDHIVDQLVLGDANIIYKERSCYAMRFIGGTQVFEFRRIPGNWGMLARNCAAVTPRGHVVLANGDVVLNDGINEPQSILTDRLKSWLFATEIDSTNYGLCFVSANPAKSEALICYPEVGESSCTKALVWNWDSNTFGVRRLPEVWHAAAGLIDYSASETWDSDADTWDSDDSAWNQNEFTPASPRLVMAANAPALYLADAGTTFDGTAMDALLERTGMAFQAPEQTKTLRAVYPRVSAPAGTVLTITAGGSMDAEQAPTWGSPVTYTVGSTYKADLFATGRYLALRIQSSGGARWRIKSLSLDIVPRGMY